MNGLLQLKKYLAEIAAKLLWAQPLHRGGTLKAYSANGRILILQEMDDGTWEVFVPIADSIKVEDTMAAVRAYCEPPPAVADSPCADGLRSAFDRAVQTAAGKLPWRAK